MSKESFPIEIINRTTREFRTVERQTFKEVPAPDELAAVVEQRTANDAIERMIENVRRRQRAQ